MSEAAESVRRELAPVQVLTVPVGVVHPNPWNPNRMNDKVFAAERESIREYGFIDPVTVRPHPTIEGEWEVIDGEHRLRAAIEEGFTEVLIAVVPLSDALAKKLTVILNETRGESDVVLLGRLLAQVRSELSEEQTLLGLPYTAAEIAHLTEIGSADLDSLQPEEPFVGQGSASMDELVEVTLGFTRAGAERFKTFQTMLSAEWDVADPGQIALRAMEKAAREL